MQSSSRDDTAAQLAALRDERLTCAGPEHLRLLKSHAKAEQLVAREYAGRALIELIQNARDAARAAELDPSDCEVLIWMESNGDDTVALTVANRGISITVPVVRASLSQFGESTKTVEIEAGAIGHKGVGFRSVLELGDVVEVYSGRDQSADWNLAARFDRRVARDLCVELSKDHWEALRLMGDHEARVVEEMEGDEPVFACLYAPLPVTNPCVAPADLVALDGKPFDTVIHLPHAHAERVREQIQSLRPEMLVLLGHVRRVRCGGSAAGAERTLEISSGPRSELDAGLHVQDFGIAAGDQLWRVFGRDEADAVSGDVRIGVPLHAKAGSQQLHLYFPTCISSGTPLLLHGPFRVDASRKHFSDAFAGDNDRAAELLATFWRDRVLPQLFGADGPADDFDPAELLLAFSTAAPSDPGLATGLCEGIQRDLLASHCIPTTFGDHVAADSLIVSVPSHFDEAIEPRLLREFGLSRPDASLDASVVNWIRPRARALDLELMAELIERGALRAEESSDVGWFSRMLRLLDGCNSWEPGLRALLDALRGRRILPARVAGSDREFELVPVDDGPPLYYRATTDNLAVPRCLGFRLLHPGVLADPQRPGNLDSGLKAVADGRLKLRPLETGPVVEDIARQDVAIEHAPDVLRFVADLLAQARGALQLGDVPLGAVGISHAGLRWQRDEESRTPRADERRRCRALSAIRLPCSDGLWRPAKKVLIGSEWSTATGRLLERVFAENRSVAWLAPPGDLAKLAPSLNGREELLLLLAVRLGAWTTLPVNSFVQYARNREGELEERNPQWVEHLIANGQLEFDGCTVPPSRVKVRVDHDFRYPQVLQSSDSDALVKLLELHWQPFFAKLQTASLACWDPKGKARKYAAERDDILSTLMWRLRHTRWFPTRWDGEGSHAKVEPHRIWIDTNVKRAGQPPAMSRYQFVAVGAREHEGLLLRGIGAIQAHGPSPAAARSELFRVRRLVGDEDGNVEHSQEAPITIRRNSPRERALGTLCATLLEAASAAGASVVDLPVLAKQDGRLRFVDPTREEVFYTGDAPQRDQQAFKHLFQAVLPRDRKGLAGKLGLREFSVVWEPQFEGTARPDTDRVRTLLAPRMAHIVALRLYWQPAGVPPFEPDGEEQQKKLNRLIDLEYLAADDLEIRGRIDGTTHTADLEGAGRREVLFVEKDCTVYHDYSGQESDALLPALAPCLAAAFATIHYEDAFARVLAAGDSEADALCLEKGIERQQLEEAAEVLRLRGVEAESRRKRLVGAFARAGAPEILAERASTELDWHRDTEPGSVLVMLEEGGADLAKLDAALEERGLERIDLGIHRRLFEKRRRLLARLTTPILVDQGTTPEEAPAELAGLSAPDTGLRVVVPVAELLGPLVDWLGKKGLDALVLPLLGGTLGREHVARILGRSNDELIALEAMTWSPPQRALMEEQARQRVVAAIVLDCVTAWLEREGAHPLPSRVRALRAEYRARAGDASVAAVQDAKLPETLAVRLQGALNVGPLTAIVEARMAGGDPQTSVVPAGLRVQVIAALERDVRARADRMRDLMQEKLDERTPAPPPEDAPPPKAMPRNREWSGRKTVGRGFGGPSERERKRRGDRGEQLVLALEVKRLHALDDDQRQRALSAIDEALRGSFDGPAVDERVPALIIALDPEASEDERIDALATYLNVAEWPGFGFDLLGWNEELEQPLFIEVKTTQTPNRFIWSEPERRRAAEEREGAQRYRIALLHQKCITWLRDPISQVTLAEKDWTASVVTEPKG